MNYVPTPDSIARKCTSFKVPFTANRHVMPNKWQINVGLFKKIQRKTTKTIPTFSTDFNSGRPIFSKNILPSVTFENNILFPLKSQKYLENQ